MQHHDPSFSLSPTTGADQASNISVHQPSYRSSSPSPLHHHHSHHLSSTSLTMMMNSVPLASPLRHEQRHQEQLRQQRRPSLNENHGNGTSPSSSSSATPSRSKSQTPPAALNRSSRNSRPASSALSPQQPQQPRSATTSAPITPISRGRLPIPNLLRFPRLQSSSTTVLSDDDNVMNTNSNNSNNNNRTHNYAHGDDDDDDGESGDNFSLDTMSRATSTSSLSAAAAAFAFQHHANANLLLDPHRRNVVVTEAEIEHYSLSYPRLQSWQIYNVCCELDDEDERNARLDRLEKWGDVLGPLVQTSQMLRESRQNRQQRNTLVVNELRTRLAAAAAATAAAASPGSSQNQNQLQQQQQQKSMIIATPSSILGHLHTTPQNNNIKNNQNNENRQQQQQPAAGGSSSIALVPFEQTVQEYSLLVPQLPRAVVQRVLTEHQTDAGRRSSLHSLANFFTIINSSTSSSSRPQLRSTTTRTAASVTRTISSPFSTTAATTSSSSAAAAASAANPNVSENTPTTTSSTTSTIPAATPTASPAAPSWFQTTRTQRRAPSHLLLLRELTETAPRFRWDAQFVQQFSQVDPALVRRNQRIYQRREDFQRYKEMFPTLPSGELERIVRDEVSDEIRFQRLTRMVDHLEVEKKLRERDEEMERQQKMAANASTKNCCRSEKCVVCNELKRLEKLLALSPNRGAVEGVGVGGGGGGGISAPSSVSSSSSLMNNDQKQGNLGNDNNVKVKPSSPSSPISDDLVLLCDLHQRQLLFATTNDCSTSDTMMNGSGGAASCSGGGAAGGGSTNKSRQHAAHMSECYICMSAPRTHCNYPCGHKCYCLLCATNVKIEVCPVCRKPIKEIIRIFD